MARSQRSSAPPPLSSLPRPSMSVSRGQQPSPNSSLVMPDPATGLDMFPRLPEIETTDPDAAAAAAASSAPSPGLSHRVAMGVRSLLGSSPSPSNSGSSSSQDHDRNSSRSLQRGGSVSSDGGRNSTSTAGGGGASSPGYGHIYCRHTWDQRCRCPVVMAAGNGDYCDGCWDGRCGGDSVTRVPSL